MKKKVAVITRHAIVNYGSFLQTYATQEILSKFGYDVSVIDYVRDDENYKNVTELLLKNSLKWNRNIITRSVYRIIQFPDHYICGVAFERIRNKWLKLTNRFTSIGEITADNLEADIFCTGSDQVWGEIGNDTIDETYFLNFPAANSKHKIAFAASFGKEKYSNERIERFQKLLSKYDTITVREQSAVDVVEKAEAKAQLILDPTFIFGAQRWREVIPKIKQKNYILLYQLNANADMDKYAGEFARKIGLPLLRISVELHNGLRSGKFIWSLSPFEFISYVDNAKYMITDSFHGTAFAIMLNTEFIEVLPKQKMTRNLNVLQKFGLEERILTNFEDFSYINKSIDYESVNEKLAMEQKKSERILSEILKGVE